MLALAGREGEAGFGGLMYQERWVKGAHPHLKVKGSPGKHPKSDLCFPSIIAHSSGVAKFKGSIPSLPHLLTWESSLRASKPTRHRAPVAPSLILSMRSYSFACPLPICFGAWFL